MVISASSPLQTPASQKFNLFDPQSQSLRLTHEHIYSSKSIPKQSTDSSQTPSINLKSTNVNAGNQQEKQESPIKQDNHYHEFDDEFYMHIPRIVIAGRAHCGTTALRVSFDYFDDVIRHGNNECPYFNKYECVSQLQTLLSIQHNTILSQLNSFSLNDYFDKNILNSHLTKLGLSQIIDFNNDAYWNVSFIFDRNKNNTPTVVYDLGLFDINETKSHRDDHKYTYKMPLCNIETMHHGCFSSVIEKAIQPANISHDFGYNFGNYTNNYNWEYMVLNKVTAYINSVHSLLIHARYFKQTKMIAIIRDPIIRAMSEINRYIVKRADYSIDLCNDMFYKEFINTSVWQIEINFYDKYITGGINIKPDEIPEDLMLLISIVLHYNKDAAKTMQDGKIIDIIAGQDYQKRSDMAKSIVKYPSFVRMSNIANYLTVLACVRVYNHENSLNNLAILQSEIFRDNTEYLAQKLHDWAKYDVYNADEIKANVNTNTNHVSIHQKTENVTSKGINTSDKSFKIGDFNKVLARHFAKYFAFLNDMTQFTLEKYSSSFPNVVFGGFSDHYWKSSISIMQQIANSGQI